MPSLSLSLSLDLYRQRELIGSNTSLSLSLSLYLKRHRGLVVFFLIFISLIFYLYRLRLKSSSSSSSTAAWNLNSLMAGAYGFDSIVNNYSRYKFMRSCALLLMMTWARCCSGFGTYGFEFHPRYSDPVKGILAVEDLPPQGSVQYYAAMAHRDRAIHARRYTTTTTVTVRGRGLADSNSKTPLTFYYGNETYRLDSLGYLHYANVSVGTPSLSFLVALDTGTNLFWLPCGCTSCVRGLQSSSGNKVALNIYSPNSSSTSEAVSCSSNICPTQNRCSSPQDNCPYQVAYLSNGTSSTGTIVEDVLHLTTDTAQSKSIDANITFGCGKVQTGSFLDGAAPNGLFGLGMSNISVPSTLASRGYTSNSFSMCFGADGVGRITFGDKGSSDQGETPFNLKPSHSLYNITINQINVGGNSADLTFSAIFDSGTSFTYLNDPAYSLISETFNNMAKDQRHASTSDIPFDYCYDIGANQQDLQIPTVNLVMQGGHQFNVTDPIVVVQLQNGAYVYCLAVVKSGDVNIIGQNFMTRYRIVFDRERNVLGWKPSNCYDALDSNTLPISPKGSVVPPVAAVNPEATTRSSNSPTSGAPLPMGNHSYKLKSLTSAVVMLLLIFVAIV